jgi:hypothetical protein
VCPSPGPLEALVGVEILENMIVNFYEGLEILIVIEARFSENYTRVLL